jgi:hypothetical protein
MLTGQRLALLVLQESFLLFEGLAVMEGRFAGLLAEGVVHLLLGCCIIYISEPIEFSHLRIGRSCGVSRAPI